MTKEAELETSARVTIDVPASQLYEMVSDVSRMGEWSPMCIGGSWDEGAGPKPGAWFTGKNSRQGHEYETRCEVTVADPAKEFTFIVGGADEGWALWGYRFTGVSESSTEVEERWELVGRHPAMVDFTNEQLVAVREGNKSNIEASLAKLKQVAEAK